MFKKAVTQLVLMSTFISVNIQASILPKFTSLLTQNSCVDISSEIYKVIISEGSIKVFTTKDGEIVWSKAIVTEIGTPSEATLMTMPILDSEGNIYISYQVKNKMAWPKIREVVFVDRVIYVDRDPFFPAYEQRFAKINLNNPNFVWNTRVKEIEFDSRLIGGKYILNPLRDHSFSTISENSLSGQKVVMFQQSHDVFYGSSFPSGPGSQVDFSEVTLNADTGEVTSTFFPHAIYGTRLNSFKASDKLNEAEFTFLNKNRLDSFLEGYFDRGSFHYIFSKLISNQSKNGITHGWLAALKIVSNINNPLFEGKIYYVYFDKQGIAQFFIPEVKLYESSVRFSEDGIYMYATIYKENTYADPNRSETFGWSLKTGKKIWTKNDFNVVTHYYSKAFKIKRPQPLSSNEPLSTYVDIVVPNEIVLAKDGYEVFKELNPATGSMGSQIKLCPIY